MKLEKMRRKELIRKVKKLTQERDNSKTNLKVFMDDLLERVTEGRSAATDEVPDLKTPINYEFPIPLLFGNEQKFTVKPWSDLAATQEKLKNSEELVARLQEHRADEWNHNNRIASSLRSMAAEQREKFLGQVKINNHALQVLRNLANWLNTDDEVLEKMDQQVRLDHDHMVMRVAEAIEALTAARE